MEQKFPNKRGRGSQLNPQNRFFIQRVQMDAEHLATDDERAELLADDVATRYIEVFPKTILNKVESPDLPLTWSANPYQGCEHGCSYCYARNTHEYWGYSAGTDFERVILVKRNAPNLLRKTLTGKNWKPEGITIAGNTDCYQPAERKYEITRDMLKVFCELKHPVALITKNNLLLRDLDLLQPMAQQNLVWVTLSLTTLNEKLKRLMEPRTSSAKNVLAAIDTLSKAGVPVHVNIAPIIPGINDHEMMEVAKQVSQAGARSIAYIVARLNGHIGAIFEDWLRRNFPDRANKVIHRIQDLHGGTVNDSLFKRRMKGEGPWAEMIAKQFALARKKFFAGSALTALDYSQFNPTGQQRLF